MSSPAEAPLALSLPLASVVLGAATHISSFKLQLDDYGWRLLGLWNLTLTLLFLWLSRSYDFLAATRLVLTFAATFLFGFFGSTTVYRFFFSPLRKFRGPWQGVLTSLYRLHAAITTDVRLFRSIDSLHKQYGDYVRIGAREISILNPSAIPLLYGAKAQCKRGTWYHHSPEAEEDRQVLLIADPTIHSWRRRILDRGFSSKGKWLPHLAIRSRLPLADYEPRVQEVINDLIRALEARTGSSVNLTDWISFFAFDAMGRVAYSQEFGMIRDGKGSVTFAGKTTSHEALRATMKMYGIFGPVPWLFKMISQIGLVGEMATFFQWCHSTMRTKQQSFDAINDTPTDISSWIIKSQNDASDINKRPTQRSLENDSILLILAGSDTAASAITNAIFYLTQDPARLAKLRAQLAALPDRSLKSLGTVRYLDHVINETLRLKPPAIEGLVRETPAGGLTLPDGVFVPGGTMVSIPPWTLHRDKRFWGEDADEFRPERFEGVDLTSETVPWMPFTRGAYTCPGKQLAYIEMRGVISAVVMGFELTLAEGQSPKEFDEGCQDSFTLTNPPLMVDLKKREV
ncbi:Tryprostatin B 6-hydroxylase [Lasiodiplodia theobromae]|uniref:Tryprostatin B 6-hydroxylase n=1 Tax=Lasiodiplodia theobromae TaxID=45133 RepID=A0A5N5D0I6_9PEZI|nr:Tryprostatin B 6-hydroxylase [Lasiodiplodia theobromae]